MLMHHFASIAIVQGECGLPENYDSKRAFSNKMDKLAHLIKQSKYTVVLTGAGISTSAGIPDFRGPAGIWTKEKEDRKRKRKMERTKQQPPVATNTTNTAKDTPPLNEQHHHDDLANGRKRKKRETTNPDEGQKFISFENALPTYTHRALAHLVETSSLLKKHESEKPT